MPRRLSSTIRDQSCWRSSMSTPAVGSSRTTHYLEEAEELCDRIAIINHGKVIAYDTKQALISRLDDQELTLVVDRDLEAVPRL